MVPFTHLRHDAAIHSAKCNGVQVVLHRSDAPNAVFGMEALTFTLKISSDSQHILAVGRTPARLLWHMELK